MVLSRQPKVVTRGKVNGRWVTETADVQFINSSLYPPAIATVTLYNKPPQNSVVYNI